jgi:hypothetical protein
MPPRRTLLVAIASVVVLAGGATGVVLLTQASGAHHLVADPTSVEFGRILHGEVTRMGVTLRNGSDHDVTVTYAQANCSCFHVDQAFQHLLHPGDETLVRIEMNSGVVPAEPLRSKILTIASDDTVSPRLEIPLHGQIVDVIQVLPPVLEYPSIEAASLPKPQKVEVRGKSPFALRLLRLDPSGAPHFDVKVAEVEGGVDLTVAFREGAKGNGPLRESVRLFLEATEPGQAPRKMEYELRMQGEWKKAENS